MKAMTRLDLLKKLGFGGTATVLGTALGDEFVASKELLPPGSIGDPDNVWFGKNIFPLPHTMEDIPSCHIEGGKIVQPARTIPVFRKADVVVVGGGPAGFAAAIAASRAGAKVALVERYGSLGGLFTNGMVLLMLCTSVREDGKWRLVTRGIVLEFAERAKALGPYAYIEQHPLAEERDMRYWQPTVDPEAAKYLMDRMVEEAKIDMFFHCWSVDTVQDGNKVLGIVFESKQGRQAILAKQVVDCTGDGDILFAAGGDYRQITHGIGHVVRLANMDRITAENPPKGDDGSPKPGMWPLRSNEGNPSTWWGNSGTGPKGNGLDVCDLTAAEIGFRKEWWEHVSTMRQEPGWEQVFIANTCSQIGPRVTRLAATETIIDRAEYSKGEIPSDTIGVFGADGAHLDPLYVPYRQLVPTGVENLLCAGRMLGAPDTCDTFRLICPCFVTGQAAGVAAAIAAKKGISPRSLAYSDVKSELLKQGAFLG